MKPAGSPHAQQPSSGEGGSMKHISLSRNQSLQTQGMEAKPVGAHPRHISPFIGRENSMGQQQEQPRGGLYFKEDSDLRKVVAQIKRNENFENGMNYLTEYLEKHPGY